MFNVIWLPLELYRIKPVFILLLGLYFLSKFTGNVEMLLSARSLFSDLETFTGYLLLTYGGWIYFMRFLWRNSGVIR